jgi:hypothetical protein
MNLEWSINTQLLDTHDNNDDDDNDNSYLLDYYQFSASSSQLRLKK